MGSNNNELARFLRTRREQVRPEQVGLPAGGRRRTPGLRREEVAARANVGATWYTWVEQGRDVNPSADVLCAIAEALLLDSSERNHVLRLAGHQPPADAADYRVAASVQPVLDALLPNPAVLLNPQGDIIRYNRSFRFVITDVEQLAPEERNVIWLDFTNSTWRDAYNDSESHMAAIVARTRGIYADTHGDPMWEPFLAKVCARSPLFRQLWNSGRVHDGSDWEKTIRSPAVGELHLQITSFFLRDRPTLRLLTYMPRDEPTRERLTRLGSSPQDGGFGA